MSGYFNLDLMKGSDYLKVRLGLEQFIHKVIRPESKSGLDHEYVNNPTDMPSSSAVSIGLSDPFPVTVIRKHNGSFAKTIFTILFSILTKTFMNTSLWNS